MQYQVPQFIQTEDKIVGPLSLRQFIYVGVAGGLSGLMYFLLQPAIWAIFSIIVIGAAVAIAFVKIQGRPLSKIIVAAFNFYWKPQTYVWQPEHLVRQKEETPPVKGGGGHLQAIASGMALHKTWEAVQTGSAADTAKTSDKQFLEQHMGQRYQIFQKPTGDRAAARRVDYR
jgi:phage-related protein